MNEICLWLSWLAFASVYHTLVYDDSFSFAMKVASVVSLAIAGGVGVLSSVLCCKKKIKKVDELVSCIYLPMILIGCTIYNISVLIFDYPQDFGEWFSLVVGNPIMFGLCGLIPGLVLLGITALVVHYSR